MCDGFIGNRMLARYGAAANGLINAGGLPQQIDGALQKEVSRSVSGVTLEDTVSADLYYPFAWDNKPTATDGPGAVTFSAAALTAAFAGRSDFSKGAPVFIHSFEVLERSNSAPYPVAFTMTGVQNAPVQSVFKPSGESFTLLLPPGHSKMNETVYTSRNLDLEHLRAHGSASMQSEYESLLPVPGLDGLYTNVLADPSKRIGVILKKNEQLLMGPGRTLNVVSAEMPMYMVSKAKVLQVLAAYNKTVVSKLPTTNFLLHTGSVARLDRAKSAAGVDGPRFADAFDAPGLSVAGRDHANNSKQLAFVVVRVRLIDPAKLK